MNINAAILWEQGAPLSVEGAELEVPRAGEVLVEVKAAGVCHSDLHPARGDWPTRTPLVLGHEGAGIVREVGKGVKGVRTGDRVVFCWAPPCGCALRVSKAALCSATVWSGQLIVIVCPAAAPDYVRAGKTWLITTAPPVSPITRSWQKRA